VERVERGTVLVDQAGVTMTEVVSSIKRVTGEISAEAVMRLSASSANSDMEFAQLEIQVQHAFLRAVELDDKVQIAAAFMSRLADRLVAATMSFVDIPTVQRQPIMTASDNSATYTGPTISS
jgi:methyl-accepting chemotaxis protein